MLSIVDKILIIAITLLFKTIVLGQSNKIFGNVKTVDSQPIGNAIVKMDDSRSELTTTQDGYFEIKFSQNKNNQLIKNINVEKSGYDPIPLNRLVLDDAIVVGRKSALEVLLHKKGIENQRKDLLAFLNKKTNGEFNKILTQAKNQTIAAQKKQLEIKNLGLDQLVDLYVNTEYKNLEKEDKDFYKTVFFSSNYEKIDSLLRARGETRKAKQVLLQAEELLREEEEELNNEINKLEKNKKKLTKKFNKYARQNLEDALTRFMLLDLKKVDSLLNTAISYSRGDFLINTSYAYGSYLQTINKFTGAQEIYDNLLMYIENGIKNYEDSIHYKYYKHKTLLKLGILALDREKVGEAKDYFEKIREINLEIDKSFEGSNDRTLEYLVSRAEMHKAIGSYYYNSGDSNSEALINNTKSLEDYQLLIDNGFSKYNAEKAGQLLNLASIYLRIGKPFKAKQHLEAGLKACEEIDVEENWDNRTIWARLNILFGEAILNIAIGGNTIKEDAKDTIDDEVFNNSESYVFKGKEIFKSLYQINANIFAEDYTYALRSLGKFNLIKNRFKKTEEYLAEAIEIDYLYYTKEPAVFGRNYAESLESIFLLHYKLNEYKKAEEYALKARSVYNFLINSNPKNLELDLNVQFNLLSMYFSMLYDEEDEQKKETISEKAKAMITNINENISSLQDPDTKLRYKERLKWFID